MKQAIVLIFLLFGLRVFSQQVADNKYLPVVKKANQKEEIFVDEAHNNFHTVSNRFKPFATLLRRAGYTVKGFTNKFSDNSLKKIKTLVISNALASGSRPPFVTPTKSAFTNEEIKVIKKWVAKGGSLFLIADHMPFAGASEKLGAAFEFKFYDSFLLDKDRRGIFDFSKKNSMLAKHKITSNKSPYGKIKRVRTFTGQAFKIPNKAQSILKTNEKLIVYLPDTMWRFSSKTKRFKATNMSQGAVIKYKKGKVAVFGEAAMFTAQLAGRSQFKVGMNAEEASENYKFLLNLIYWLQSK
ncbi:hypothetical protein [Tenacibaculum halocynthiae]|uniref:hypothetical protein n=1 Tax=Tenacibaculum halocynthiae TaxID=1254437 RepID=UPI0038954C3E